MSVWLPAVPGLLGAVLLVLGPGLVVGYALGVRGISAWGLAPPLSLSVLTTAAALAPVMHVSWTPWLYLAATVTAGLLAYGLALLIRHLSRDRPDRSERAREPAHTSAFAAAGVLLGAVLVLAAVLPGIGSPDELVDSTDVAAHLNRIRRFLETGNFSFLAPDGRPPYPRGFHDLAGTLAQGVAGLTDGRGLVTAANLTAVVISAVVWPIGFVALSRLCLGRQGVVLVAAGVLAAAFTTFPYVLLGWGVLWPNLLGTALLPGVLGPALVAVRCVAPVPGLPSRLAVGSTLAALPGLTFAHPNALVSLVFFILAAVGTRLGLRCRYGSRVDARRAGVGLAVLLLGTVVGLMAIPRLSQQVADTASYDWKAHGSLVSSLRDVALLGLQVGRLPWGLLVVMVIGAVFCAQRARLWWVLVAWAGCVLLFVFSATGQPGWGPLLTGYWYNDKVRLAALTTIPAGLLAVAGTVVAAHALWRLLGPLSHGRWTAPVRRLALATSAAAAVALVVTLTGGVNHDETRSLVDRYYHPGEVYQVLLLPEEEAALQRLAGLIPDGVMTADVPSNGSVFLYALDYRRVLFDSLLLDSNPDHALIGLHLKDAATRTDVCDALRRSNVQYAVTGPVRYWLSFPDRTSGMEALAGTPGFVEEGAAGPYRLYRIQACGFDPTWLPPEG